MYEQCSVLRNVNISASSTFITEASDQHGTLAPVLLISLLNNGFESLTGSFVIY